MVLFGELFGLHVIRLDLRPDHGAVALRILRLDDRDRMRITPGTSGQSEPDNRRRKQSGTRDDIPPNAPAIAKNSTKVLEMFYTTNSELRS